MADQKCPNCGASIVAGTGMFCSFCGTKLPDNIQRIEINENRRVEISNESEMEKVRLQREIMQREDERARKAERSNRIKLCVLLALAGLLVLGFFRLKANEYIGPILLIYYVLFALFVLLIGVALYDKSKKKT